ncbi:hypothetical protein ACSFBM_07305 [Variovorax sp. GB1R11]|uniref:hypothetical protein n=1 Tax=Variovorax sp. GB1R11 TaxID=3443741 RepID=UPI003F4808A0
MFLNVVATAAQRERDETKLVLQGAKCIGAARNVAVFFFFAVAESVPRGHPY